jgi:Raf kinase inhibitor-like YbhB/YbcL family protein
MFSVRRFAALAFFGLLALAMVVAACEDSAEAPGDGGNGGQTPAADETPANGETPDDGPFTLTSDGFAEGDAIPVRYTCDGDDTSPALMWSGAPAGTQAFAIIVDDPDAPTDEPFVHFVVYDLPGGETGLEEGIPVPAQPNAGGSQGRNDFGRTGWGGPCPPEGETHTYVFTLYALDSPLSLDAGATKQQVLDAIEGHVLDEAQLTAAYGR